MDGSTVKVASGFVPRPVEESEDVSVFQPREKRVRVAAYVPEAMKARLDSLQRLWTFIERLEDPKVSEWSESDVVGRLVAAGIDNAWAEFGGEPKSEADWKRVEDALRKAKPAKTSSR